MRTKEKSEKRNSFTAFMKIKPKPYKTKGLSLADKRNEIRQGKDEQKVRHQC